VLGPTLTPLVIVRGSVEAVRAPTKRKMRMSCPKPVFCTWPNSLTPRLAYELRGAFNFALVFYRWSRAGNVGAVQATSPTRTVWRFHVPRIWIRSINPCRKAVKRKSQNLA